MGSWGEDGSQLGKTGREGSKSIENYRMGDNWKMAERKKKMKVLFDK